MSKLSMCRLCLDTNVQMYSLLDTPLQQIYENIVHTPLQAGNKPVQACYICFAHLKRCHRLMVKALRADHLLNQLLTGGTELSSNTLDLQSQSFAWSYMICPAITVTIEETETADVAVPVKHEVFKAEKTEGNEDIVSDVEPHNIPEAPQQSSDSEDDIPLQKISKRIEKKTRIKVRKKEREQKDVGKGFIADFAKEIILSKEQQLEELKQRAESLNYLNSPLKCEHCFKGFVDTAAFRNHMRKHDEESGPNECEICHMRYITLRQLRTHVATSHSRRYACTKCSHRSHTANQAREHEKWHGGHTYECKLCGQVFRKPTSYLTHTRKQHPSTHSCAHCGHSFLGARGLRMHLTKSHHDQPPENSSEPASDRFCSECNIQFVSKDAWQRHILSSASHTTHTHDNTCAVCSCVLGSRAALQSHLRAHHKALRPPRVAPSSLTTVKLQCTQCGNHFVNRSKLQAHVKRIHLGLKYNKNIICEVCGKKCTSAASLRYHQRTHTGERPHACALCPKRFTDHNQLTIHTRTHTGERPYCCAICGKRFSQKPALNRHYRVHTGAKPYTCSVCSKPFSQSNSLKLHVRTVHLKLPAPKRGNKDKTEVREETQSKGDNVEITTM